MAMASALMRTFEHGSHYYYGYPLFPLLFYTLGCELVSSLSPHDLMFFFPLLFFSALID